MKNILTVGELKEILQDYDDKMPVEVGAYIDPDDIIKNIKQVKQFKKDVGGCIYCFQTEHTDVGEHYGCLVICGAIELERLE